MAYWLMKSEPTAYSLADLEGETTQTTHWDGVRNYQARNFMRDHMAIGDLCFFYHSNCKVPGIVGVVEVVSSAYPDFTAFDSSDPHYDPKSDPKKPRWMMVDIKFQQSFPQQVSLPQLRACADLADMMILRRGNRLSITPVLASEWRIVHLMSNPSVV